MQIILVPTVGGNPSLTATRDFDYDQNGNIYSVPKGGKGEPEVEFPCQASLVGARCE